MTAADPVALLTGAVAIASPSGDERPAADYLVEAMRRFCHEADVDAVGNAVGHWGVGARRVWLLGHIDTVPGHIDVRIEDGVLHGRGSVDAKGSFCAFMSAVARLPASLAADLSITLIGAVGEEAPGSVGARHAVRTLAAPDLVVIGEPSGWDGVTLGYKGTMQVELSADEPVRHTSVDLATVAEKLVEAYGAVRERVEVTNLGQGSQFERLQLRLLDFRTADDGLRQSARARLGLRLPPSADPEGLAAEIAALAEPAGVRCEVVPGAVGAHRTSKGGELPAALRAAIRSVGGTPRHKLKTGTSDMNVVAAAWRSSGVEAPPMVAYGPGDSTLDHTPEEHIVLSEYLTSVAVLESALRALAVAPAVVAAGAACGAAS